MLYFKWTNNLYLNLYHLAISEMTGITQVYYRRKNNVVFKCRGQYLLYCLSVNYIQKQDPSLQRD